MDGRKHATIEAGGKIYNLRISYNALSEYNDKIGPSSDFNDKPLKAFRGLVWAGINAYGSQTVTVEQAGDICEDFIAEKGLQAFKDYMQNLIDTSNWLGVKKGGTDTGNPSPIMDPPAPLVKSSKNTSGQRTVSEG